MFGFDNSNFPCRKPWDFHSIEAISCNRLWFLITAVQFQSFFFWAVLNWCYSKSKNSCCDPSLVFCVILTKLCTHTLLFVCGQCSDLCVCVCTRTITATYLFARHVISSFCTWKTTKVVSYYKQIHFFLIWVHVI